MDANEFRRLIVNLIRKGSIADVDLTSNPPTCRVSVGDPDDADNPGLTTNWIPFATTRAGTTREWSPLTKGEQVILLCPMGDPAQGIAVAGINSDAAPAPSHNADKHLRVHSLKPAIAEALAKIVIAHIDQTHESDMSFLTRVAKRYDAVMNVKDLRLLFMPIGTGKTASGRALSVLNITRRSGDQHRYHVSQRESYAAVRAHYHSNGQGKRKSVIVGGDNNHNVKVLPEDYATEAEARAAAEAEFARTQRSQATLDYTLALGQAEIFPELPVTVSGFKAEIDETPWLVKKATHAIGDGGFTTALELEVRDDPTTDRHRSHFRKVG
ncbi:phage baseplate assembly protein V [Paraburkholderia silvatlantica]|nr:phage baseplate assembly protein V [Paraburkholderia silvatlantica]